MYCGKCGTEIAEGNDYCSNCGLSLEMESTEEKNVPSTGTTINLKSKKKVVLLIGIIAIAIAIGIVLYFITLSRGSQLLPYGLKWGATYEEVVEKDKSATKPEKNDSGDYFGAGSLDNQYFDINSITSVVAYNFGKNEALNSAAILAVVDKNGSLNDDDFYSYLVDYYTKLCRKEPVKTSLGCSWETDDGNVNIIRERDHLFAIMLDSPT